RVSDSSKYSQLKLKAELVMLSACESGRGQNVRGEGLIGLTRALQCDGARSVLASQWKVADFSTAQLMLTFHRHLRAGLAKDEALRRAMARVRQAPEMAHPYFWTAFFLARLWCLAEHWGKSLKLVEHTTL